MKYLIFIIKTTNQTFKFISVIYKLLRQIQENLVTSGNERNKCVPGQVFTNPTVLERNF